MAKNKQITLKEAAKISGYSPDYIGQLIRQGKISGRLVYHNVAWVTTEKDIKDYISKSKQNKNSPSSATVLERTRSLKVRIESSFSPVLLMRVLFYITAVLAVLVFLFLFYVFSVGFDKKIEKNILDSMPASSVPTQDINFNENGSVF